MGINQPVVDHVERLTAVLLEERAAVIDDDEHPGIIVGLLGVEPPPELDDARIDLHGAHARVAVAQRGLDVVAGSRPDDQRPPAGLGQDEGEVVHRAHAPHRVVSGHVRQIEHVLMEVPVHEQREAEIGRREIDAVVG